MHMCTYDVCVYIYVHIVHKEGYARVYTYAHIIYTPSHIYIFALLSFKLIYMTHII